MADWNQPQLSSLYTNVLTNLKDRDVDSATLFLNTPTNPVTGFIRFNRTTNLFEEWNGSAWVVRALSIGGGGTGATTAAGARTNLGLGSMALQNDNNVNITGGTISGLTSLSVSGTISAGVFSGSGSGLSNIPNSATTATNLNSPNTIVLRDGSGNFSAGTITASLNGNANTVTNGVYTTGSYADPAWITSLAGSKITSGINAANISTGTLDDGRLSSRVLVREATYNQAGNTSQAFCQVSPYDTETYREFTLQSNEGYEIFSNSLINFFITSTAYFNLVNVANSGTGSVIALPGGSGSPLRIRFNQVGEYDIIVYVTFELTTNSGFVRLRIEDASAESGFTGPVIGRSEAYSAPGFVVLVCHAKLLVTSVPRYIACYVFSTVSGARIVTFQGQKSAMLTIQKVW
jgi:hypothetical protein